MDDRELTLAVIALQAVIIALQLWIVRRFFRYADDVMEVRRSQEKAVAEIRRMQTDPFWAPPLPPDSIPDPVQREVA